MYTMIATAKITTNTTTTNPSTSERLEDLNTINKINIPHSLTVSVFVVQYK